MTTDIRHSLISITAGVALLGTLGLTACDKSKGDPTPPDQTAKTDKPRSPRVSQAPTPTAAAPTRPDHRPGASLRARSASTRTTRSARVRIHRQCTSTIAPKSPAAAIWTLPPHSHDALAILPTPAEGGGGTTEE